MSAVIIIFDEWR